MPFYFSNLILQFALSQIINQRIYFFIKEWLTLSLRLIRI